MAKEAPNSPALLKMMALRDRIQRNGVAWPPLSAEVERERMRERGDTPIVPVGHTR